MPARPPDPVALARDLIRCPSITPQQAGALDLIQDRLARRAFACQRLPFGEVDNLYARRGRAAPHFCFAGHVDVVPPGDPSLWRFPPFEARIDDGKIYGRGALDMKGAIAAFLTGLDAFLDTGAAFGSISLLLTSDEEGPARDGTARALAAILSQGETIDDCLVGEPTSRRHLGEAIKIGRRGSLSAHLTVAGRQGHVAYPGDALNPIPLLARIISRLPDGDLDRGSRHFSPSHLEITSVDVGNPAGNVIPARAAARLNIRYNDTRTAAGLETWLEDHCRAALGNAEAGCHIEFEHGGECFLTEPGPFTDCLIGAVADETGRTPELSTAGGTSDARFIHKHARTAELGLAGTSLHQIDEHVPLDDLKTLGRIYARVLARYFARA